MIKDYLITWWCYVRDDYVDYEQLITASSPQNGIDIIKSIPGYIYRAGKNWEAHEVIVTNYKTKDYIIA
jgi:hypothetical protein